MIPPVFRRSLFFIASVAYPFQVDRLVTVSVFLSLRCTYCRWSRSLSLLPYAFRDDHAEAMAWREQNTAVCNLPFIFLISAPALIDRCPLHKSYLCPCYPGTQSKCVCQTGWLVDEGMQDLQPSGGCFEGCQASLAGEVRRREISGNNRDQNSGLDVIEMTEYESTEFSGRLSPPVLFSHVPI